MDALLMCGGEGSRLEGRVEKPLLAIGGRAMVDRVADALLASRIETAYAAVSPNAPRTREHVDLPQVETPGQGYVSDLGTAIESVGTPVLTAAADLPLLAREHVDVLLDVYAAGDGDSVVTCVPAVLKRQLGTSVEGTRVEHGREVVLVGLNVVDDGPDAIHLSYDARLAVNVNRRTDAELAGALV